jgi:hypothetical protein
MVVSAACPLGYEVRPSRIFSSSPDANRTNLRCWNTDIQRNLATHSPTSTMASSASLRPRSEYCMCLYMWVCMVLHVKHDGCQKWQQCRMKARHSAAYACGHEASNAGEGIRRLLHILANTNTHAVCKDRRARGQAIPAHQSGRCLPTRFIHLQ